MHTSAKPAVALYKFWDYVLAHSCTTGSDTLAFGQQGWVLRRETAEIIGFGQGGNPHFEVDKKGRFRLNQMHGTYRRNVVARHVPFLRWSYTHSRYQWFVDFSSPENLYWWSSGLNLRDYTTPRRYVSEDLLGCRTYYQSNSWCVLVKDGEGWIIQPAKDQTYPGRHDEFNQRMQNQLPSLRERWQKYERIVEARYARAQRIATGQSEPVSVVAPRLLNKSKPLPPEVATERLVALLEVDLPAKTTPLKRPKEATNGADHMAPAHIV